MAFERLDQAYNLGDPPALPAIPERLGTGGESSILLTRQDMTEWEFLFEEIPGIPSAYDQVQDYNFNTIPQERWDPVTVPGSLIMQGFDVQNNTEYYYRRTLSIPPSFAGCHVFLRFEGIYSHARVWVNGHFVRSHAGGFTAWDCEITSFAGTEAVTLVIGVTDAEGEKKGPWNPGGEKISSAAWASYYAHCNVGGILRDITLFALPEHHITRTRIGTYVPAGAPASVEVSCELVAADEDILTARLLNSGGETAAEFSGTLAGFQIPRKEDAPIAISPCKRWARKYPKSAINDRKYSPLHIPSPQAPAGQGERYGVRFTLPVPDAKLWDAEHPNLYQLCLTLSSGGRMVQENVHPVGIREITYGGTSGTDRNKVYINGKEIKLRGLCHHDVSHLYGRSITRSDIEREIRIYKEHNINHIRTSHYPASDYFLTVCDRMGIYVEQENSVCFKGANNFAIYNPPEEFLTNFAEMVEYARNHPSVLIWSLANESGFEETYAFRAEYDYIKSVDRSRPVIFSYPDTVHTKPRPYDIYSRHYNKVTGKLGRDDLPVLHDEFAHVACYNTEHLREDNSCREAWGESIARGWDNIFHTEGALGCAIWAGIDDVFYLPQGTQERHQKHTGGRCAGYGEWGCIFDAYKRLKPEAYLTKKAFTPVLVDEQQSALDKTIRLYITNRFDHTNLAEVRAVCADADGNILFDGNIPQSIAPHRSGYIELPCTADGAVNIQFFQDGYQVDEYALGCQNPEPAASDPAGVLPFTSDARGLFGTPRLSVRGLAGKKACKNVQMKHIRHKGNHLTGIFRAGGLKTFGLDMEKKDCELDCRLYPKNIFAWFTDPSRITLEVDLMDDVQSVSWHRKAFYTIYPAGHIGRPEGTASVARGDGIVPDPYGKKPDYGWEQSMTNYFISKADGETNSVATNDFKTRRNNIHDYTVHLKNRGDVRIDSKCRNLNAFVRLRRCASGVTACLQLTLGSYYPDLQWGNYFGKRAGFGKKMHFSVSLPNSKTNQN